MKIGPGLFLLTLLLAIASLVPSRVVASDAVFDGNQVYPPITYHYIVTGNLIVKDNATLIIRQGGLLEMLLTKPWEFEICIQDNGTLILDNGHIVQRNSTLLRLEGNANLTSTAGSTINVERIEASGATVFSLKDTQVYTRSLVGTFEYVQLSGTAITASGTADTAIQIETTRTLSISGSELSSTSTHPTTHLKSNSDIEIDTSEVTSWSSRDSSSLILESGAKIRVVGSSLASLGASTGRLEISSAASITMADSTLKSDATATGTLELEAPTVSIHDSALTRAIQFGGNTSAYLYNVTAPDLTAAQNAFIQRYWWLTVHVVDSSRFPVAGASVSVFSNRPGNVTKAAYGVTSMSGILRLQLLAETLNRTRRDFIGNYLVNATYRSASTLETGLPLTSNSEVSLVLPFTQSSLSLELTADRVAYGTSVTLSGSLNPPASMPVVVQFTKDQSTIQTPTTTDDKGVFRVTWRAPSAGEYTVLAYWSGDATHPGAASPQKTLIVDRALTDVTIQLTAAGLFGGPIVISGHVEPRRQEVEVRLIYSEDGTSWLPIETVKTNTSGDYSVAWYPPKQGRFLLRAESVGNANYRDSATSPEPTDSLTSGPGLTLYAVMAAVGIGVMAMLLLTRRFRNESAGSAD